MLFKRLGSLLTVMAKVFPFCTGVQILVSKKYFDKSKSKTQLLYSSKRKKIQVLKCAKNMKMFIIEPIYLSII